MGLVLGLDFDAGEPPGSECDVPKESRRRAFACGNAAAKQRCYDTGGFGREECGLPGLGWGQGPGRACLLGREQTCMQAHMDASMALMDMQAHCW